MTKHGEYYDGKVQIGILRRRTTQLWRQWRQIDEMRRAGKTYREAGASLGVGVERARQICLHAKRHAFDSEKAFLNYASPEELGEIGLMARALSRYWLPDFAKQQWLDIQNGKRITVEVSLRRHPLRKRLRAEWQVFTITDNANQKDEPPALPHADHVRIGDHHAEEGCKGQRPDRTRAEVRGALRPPP